MARFKKGEGGRPKGAKNKLASSANELAERMGCNPLEILLHYAMGNWKALGHESPTLTKRFQDGSTAEIPIISEEIRAGSAKEACKYIYPQKKAIDHNITPEQQAIFSKIAAAIEAKKNGS